jgi:hypothetical protein
MSFLSKRKSQPLKFLQEHHFLFIERPFQDVADEILLWGWSSWWPKESALQYSSLDDAKKPEVGMPCKVSLDRKFMQAVFKGDVVQFKDQKVLQIEWRSGMMIGQEFIIVEERSNGVRMDHRVRYTGSNFLAKAIWVLLFRKRYDLCLNNALDALREHLTART